MSDDTEIELAPGENGSPLEARTHRIEAKAQAVMLGVPLHAVIAAMHSHCGVCKAFEEAHVFYHPGLCGDARSNWPPEHQCGAQPIWDLFGETFESMFRQSQDTADAKLVWPDGEFHDHGGRKSRADLSELRSDQNDRAEFEAELELSKDQLCEYCGMVRCACIAE